LYEERTSGCCVLAPALQRQLCCTLTKMLRARTISFGHIKLQKRFSQHHCFEVLGVDKQSDA